MPETLPAPLPLLDPLIDLSDMSGPSAMFAWRVRSDLDSFSSALALSCCSGNLGIEPSADQARPSFRRFIEAHELGLNSNAGRTQGSQLFAQLGQALIEGFQFRPLRLILPGKRLLLFKPGLSQLRIADQGGKLDVDFQGELLFSKFAIALRFPPALSSYRSCASLP